MGRSQLVPPLLVAAALLLAPRAGRAQSAQQKAAAEAAFEEGKRLMMAHAYADACAKLAESQRLDPGLGTMLGLADCYEKNGQTASAWAEFREAAAAAARKQDRREALARENAARLEPMLTKLVIAVAPEADVRGLLVKRDGVDVGRAEWGVEVPVDPGQHTVSASAPAMKDWQGSVELPKTPGVRTISVPRLEAAPPTPSSATPAAAPAGDPGRTQKIAAVAAGGAGVVGLAVASVFGLKAKSHLDDSNASGHCDAANTCDATGLAARSDAKSTALVSTVAFVVGGAALAGGAVLWLTAPKAEPASARVGLAPSPGGVTVLALW